MKNSSRFTLTFWILAIAAIFEVLYASFMLDPNLDYCENDWYPGSCAQQKAQGGFKGTGKSANATNGTFVQLDNNELVSNEGYNTGKGEAIRDCIEYGDKSACQALIDNGLRSVEQCTKDICLFVGIIYGIAGHFREEIPYFERAIALGDNRAYYFLGLAYYNLNDYFNAKKYYEIGCNKVSDMQSESCYNLGLMYHNGKGVRQDYHKASELWKKACDMKNGFACNNLGALYGKGQGVRQNRSIAKQYYGKACDLGDQMGCDNYKEYNEAGVQ
ncbi:tetratricopeptide repeat protein [Helicobacter sp. T3_23-1059]